MISEYPTGSRLRALTTERSSMSSSKRIAATATGMKSFDPVLPAYRISFRRRVVKLVVRINALLTIVFLTRLATSMPIAVDAAEPADTPTVSNPSSFFSIRMNENPGVDVDLLRDNCDVTIDHDNDGSGGDNNNNNSSNNGRRRSSNLSSTTFYGFGREFSLFHIGPRGGARNENYNNDYSYEGYSDDSDGNGNNSDDEDDDDGFLTRMERFRTRRKSSASILGSGGFNNNEGYALSRGGRPSYMPRSSQSQGRRRKQQQRQKPKIVLKAQSWWMDKIDPKLQSLPKIVCRIEPTTTLKLRKTFRPLKTIIRLGADYNTQQGIWQFKSSWEDAIIGGKLTLSGNKELQVTKSWHLSVGGVEDLVTRLRFRATINLQTFQAYARVGFRTERLTPIDLVEGFTILKRLPLDGSGGNLKLEVKACVALPEPEIEYSTEAQRSLIGMGDIEVSIDEMNLLLDY